MPGGIAKRGTSAMLNIDFAASPHWADAFQGLGTLAAAVISLVGFVFVIRQLRYTRQAIETQTQAQIYNMGLEAYKIVIEHPELGQYIYDGAALPKSGPERHKALSAFELFCDYFEYIILQDGAVSSDVRDSWIRYMEKLFQRSIALQEFVSARKDQYTPQFYAVFERAVRPLAR
jgi:hypothetical protein